MRKVLGFSHNFPLGAVSEKLQNFEILMPSSSLGIFSDKELETILPNVDGFICIADTPFGRHEFANAPRLACLGNLGSGFNNIDVVEATERSIPVLNTPQAVVNPTAENTVSLILGLTRGTVRYDRSLRETGICPKELLSFADMTLEGKTLGIVGYGRIGRRVGMLASAFGMHVVHTDSHSPESLPLEELLKQSDVVSLHLPYRPENHHLINERTLSLMKPSAYLVNVSRGPIVKEDALVHALRNNLIKGAGLDVHENEPFVSEEVQSLSNVVITPHISTNLAEIRFSMLAELLEGMNTIFSSGKLPKNTVNSQELSIRRSKS